MGWASVVGGLKERLGKVGLLLTILGKGLEVEAMSLEMAGRTWGGARASKVLLNHIFKLLEGIRIDVKLPFKILTKFTLHSVDLPKLEHPLTND